MPAAQTCPAVAAHGVDLIDEDDGRGILFSLFKQVAHAAGADTDKHLDEFTAANIKEGHSRLAGDGFGHERLAGSRRSEEKHAFGGLGAPTEEFFFVF